MKIKVGELRALVRESILAINTQTKLKPLMAHLDEKIAELEEEFMEYNLDHEAHIDTTVDGTPVGRYSDVELWERQVEFATQELRHEVELAIKKSQEKLYGNKYVHDIKVDMMPTRRWQ